MADETETPATPADKPAPRRRPPRTPTADKPARTPRRAKAKPKDEAPSPVAAEATPAPTKRRAPAKPRAAKRPVAQGRTRKPSSVEKATDKVGGKWGAAAVAGGIAAAGAAAAALLTLRGSTRKATERPANPGAKAHQPDGTDSSKSFQAGIADENTVPEK